MTRGPLARFGAVLGAGAVGLALALAVSVRAGGPLSFVVTSGSSMLPGITPGTLVVLRDTDAYAVGDVVGYRDPELRTVVLHRVTGRDGERLVLQGDNNSWTDPHRPAPHEVVGERLVQVPGVGPVARAVTRPGPAGGLAAAAVLVLLAGGSRSRRRRSSGARQGVGARGSAPLGASAQEEQDVTQDPRGAQEHDVPADHDVWWEDVRHDETGAPWYLHAGTWYDHDGRPARRPAPAARTPSTATARAAAAGALAAVALGCWSFTAPATRDTTTSAEARWQAAFSYSGDARRGAAYPDGAVSTGQPVFTRLVDAVDVSVDLALQVPAGTAGSGTWRLVTEVSDESGWRRVVRTGPSRPLPADGGSMRVRVEPRELSALADAAARETGAPAAQRRVVVRALVDLELASAAGRTTTTASPELAFELDEASLRADPATLTASGASAVAVPAKAPGRLALGPLAVDVGTARTAALAALAGCSVVLAGSRRRADSPEAKESALVARHRDLVVPLAPGVRHAPHLPVVDLDAFEALLALARRYDRVVLQEDVDGRTSYVLPEDGLLYRWSRPVALGPGLLVDVTAGNAGDRPRPAPAAADDADSLGREAVRLPAPRRAADDAARAQS